MRSANGRYCQSRVCGVTTKAERRVTIPSGCERGAQVGSAAPSRGDQNVMSQKVMPMPVKPTTTSCFALGKLPSTFDAPPAAPVKICAASSASLMM
jgi:hypothetical protein